MVPDMRQRAWRHKLPVVACLAAAAWLVVHAVAPAGPPPVTRAAAPPVEALLIGDSVLNGLAQGYGAPARAALGGATFVHPRERRVQAADHDQLPHTARLGADECDHGTRPAGR